MNAPRLPGVERPARSTTPGADSTDRSVHDLARVLPLVALAMAAVYAHLALGHWLVQAGPTCAGLAVVSGATSAAFVGMWAALKRWPPPAGRAHLAAALIAGLVLLNCAVELGATGELARTESFVLLEVGLGALLVSRRWFWGLALAVAATWVLLVASGPALPGVPIPSSSPIHEVHSIFSLILGLALATLIFESRRRISGRVSELLARSEIQEHRLSSALESVQESEARTSAVLKGAMDGIVVIDEEGIIESFNPAASRLFGYEPGEVVGRNVNVLMPEPYRTLHDQYLARYLSTGESRIMGRPRELVGQRRDGTTFPLEISISESWVGGRRIFTGITRDITDRRESERRVLRETRVREAAEERARLARDLHDGVLQVLTGASLQLWEIERRVQGQPEVADRLRALRQSISEEQRELRFFVERLKPSLVESLSERRLDLRAELEALATRVKGIWNIEVDVCVEVDDTLPDSVHHELCRIVQESLVNAARHGGAGRVGLSVGQVGRALRLRIADDGCGFQFSGRVEDAELRRREMGPALLRSRVLRSGGALSIESCSDGAVLDITLPFNPRTDP